MAQIISKQNTYYKSCSFIALSILVLISGCQVGSRPRLRRSDFFGNPWGMRLPDPNNLGCHCLDDCHGEQLGLVYTCRGGFIDLGHLREAADRTYFLSQLIYKDLMGSKTNFSYRVIEPSYYHVTLSYPSSWKNLSRQEKEKTAREISIHLGQYLAHTSLIWHEILTWYNFASSGLFSENISAFSPEDPYSDVLGTHLAAKVLLSQPSCFYEESDYEEAMTTIISETLKKLGAQSPEVAKQALKKIKGDWYDGGYYFFVEMKKRNLDVGLDDGLVTPWQVQGMCPDAQPQSCPAPNFGFLDKYGFKIRVRLEPVEFQKKAIFAEIGLKPTEEIIPCIHFPMIIEKIREKAKKLHGPNSDSPN